MAIKKLQEQRLTVFNILTSDILIADNNIQLPYRTQEQIERLEAQNPHHRGQYRNVDTAPELDETEREQYKRINALLDQWLGEKGVARGNKLQINKDKFIQMSEAVEGIRSVWTAGGSSANTLHALTHLIGPDKIHADFLGVVGGQGGTYSNIIRHGLQKANIRLIQPPLEPGQIPESAVSFVFNDAVGKTTITYPGNARHMLRPELITEELVDGRNALLMQGSMFDKFPRHHKDARSMPDELLYRRYELEKRGRDIELWYAAPTQKKFDGYVQPEDHHFIRPSADVHLQNMTELMNLYATDSKDEAVEKLQQTLRLRDVYRARDGLRERPREARGWVTDDGNPVTIVTPTDVISLPVLPLPEGRKNYMVGAGDSSYAGFLAGHLANLSARESGLLALHVASTNLAHNSARSPHPRQDVEQGPHLGKHLLRKMDNNLEQAQGNGSSRV